MGEAASTQSEGQDGNACGGDESPRKRRSSVAHLDTPWGDEEAVMARRIGMPIPKMKPWQPDEYVYCRHLQDAPRSKGEVSLHQNSHSGEFVAVKRMPKRWVTDSPKNFEAKNRDDPERPWLNFCILKLLHDCGFAFGCRFHGVYDDEHAIYQVTSFAGMDLLTWSGACEICAGAPREEMMRPVMQQLFAAVRELHDIGIAHRDLSVENVMIEGRYDVDCLVRLVDFGMATCSRRYGNSPVGKPRYRAPEISEIESKPDIDSFLTDSFALGVIMFGLIFCQFPWSSTEAGQCGMFALFAGAGLLPLLMELKAYTPGENQLVSRNCRRLLSGLLAVNAATRLTSGEACWRKTRASVYHQQWLPDSTLVAEFELEQPSTPRTPPPPWSA